MGHLVWASVCLTAPMGNRRSCPNGISTNMYSPRGILEHANRYLPFLKSSIETGEKQSVPKRVDANQKFSALQLKRTGLECYFT